jgi:heat shock protein HslJ
MINFGGWLQALAIFAVIGSMGPSWIPPALASQADWRASGNEPSWSLVISNGKMTLETDFGANRVELAVPPATKVDARTVRYTTSIENQSLEVNVKNAVCIDTMTGMPRPEQVAISFGAKRFTGCGGDPASLLKGEEWTVVSLAGEPVLEKPQITMTFAENGRLSGLGSCNRFNAEYQITGEGLSIGKGMSSMMACEEPVMKQEQLFLELLERVSRFSIAADGTLNLHSDRDRTISARRP